ncbi:hypothetical protein H5410_018239 [Solanum commersonii]|uniref:Uncharacterized protein n=1 Tax=Solanum commersonii TaxID=4109 RepID=A0A9J6A2S8_SOLCO|nr:hypothetical protein H5410_018239 [Solanum commersonii]
MADGGEGWLRNHSNMGSRSFPRLYNTERNPLAGRSLTFSTPAGIEGHFSQLPMRGAAGPVFRR